MRATSILLPSNTWIHFARTSPFLGTSEKQLPRISERFGKFQGQIRVEIRKTNFLLLRYSSLRAIYTFQLSFAQKF